MNSSDQSNARPASAEIEISAAFLKLGLISFGGPVAHLGYLREEFVMRRGWVTEAAYGDLVALCQLLPGPTSSQLVFALGRQHGGWLGGLLASLCFTLPSAVLMILFGYGVARLGNLAGAGWLHGLKLVTVAVVAQAVWGMGRNLCPDRARLIIALMAAALVLLLPGALTQVGIILSGGLVGWWLYHEAIPGGGNPGPADWRHHVVAGGMLAVFLLLLFALPVAASVTGRKEIAVFDSFFRAGSLVFGGGHVILPLLRAEVVPPGWVADATFMAGYGAAQAVPGPLFSFSGFLGVAIFPGPEAWLGGLWCLLAIFLPAGLIIGGALPFWQQLRSQGWAQASLRGANATVVGILFAAFCNPVLIQGVRNLPDAVAAIIGFGLLQWMKLPPWLVVAVTVAAGQWVLP